MINISDFLNVVRFSISKSHISNCEVTREELHTLIDKIMDGEDVIYYNDDKTEIVEDFLLDKLEERPNENNRTMINLTTLFTRKRRAQ